VSQCRGCGGSAGSWPWLRNSLRANAVQPCLSRIPCKFLYSFANPVLPFRVPSLLNWPLPLYSSFRLLGLPYDSSRLNSFSLLPQVVDIRPHTNARNSNPLYAVLHACHHTPSVRRTIRSRLSPATQNRATCVTSYASAHFCHYADWSIMAPSAVSSQRMHQAVIPNDVRDLPFSGCLPLATRSTIQTVTRHYSFVFKLFCTLSPSRNVIRNPFHSFRSLSAKHPAWGTQLCAFPLSALYPPSPGSQSSS